MKNDELAVGVGLVLSMLVALFILVRPGCATAQEYSSVRVCGGLGAAVKMACQQAEGPEDVCHRSGFEFARTCVTGDFLDRLQETEINSKERCDFLGSEVRKQVVKVCRLSAKKCRKLADETTMILLRACDEAIRDSTDETI